MGSKLKKEMLSTARILKHSQEVYKTELQALRRTCAMSLVASQGGHDIEQFRDDLNGLEHHSSFSPATKLGSA